LKVIFELKTQNSQSTISSATHDTFITFIFNDLTNFGAPNPAHEAEVVECDRREEKALLTQMNADYEDGTQMSKWVATIAIERARLSTFQLLRGQRRQVAGTQPLKRPPWSVFVERKRAAKEEGFVY
jgi:hypothetical protein